MGRKPRTDLDERDRRALDWVRAYCTQHGRPPSYREVGEFLELDHPNHANRICDRLVELGHLSGAEAPGRGGGGPRARALKMVPRLDLVFPFRGRVSCGAGAENDEDFENAPLDAAELLRGRDLAAYEADGDSMRDALIAAGDILLVSENPDPPVGSVVIALYNRELVCKKLTKKRPDLVRLESCALGYEPIEFNPLKLPSFRIMGVLRKVIRSL